MNRFVLVIFNFLCDYFEEDVDDPKNTCLDSKRRDMGQVLMSKQWSCILNEKKIKRQKEANQKNQKVGKGKWGRDFNPPLRGVKRRRGGVHGLVASPERIERDDCVAVPEGLVHSDVRLLPKNHE